MFFEFFFFFLFSPTNKNNNNNNNSNSFTKLKRRDDRVCERVNEKRPQEMNYNNNKPNKQSRNLRMELQIVEKKLEGKANEDITN